MLDQAKHRDVLVSVLSDIYSDPRICHCLGFKGGTALYLFYKLNRFSVDLDFDLLDSTKGDLVHEVLLEIVLQYGRIKNEALKHYGGLVAISYEKGQHHLKIDVSHREPNASYESKLFLGVPALVMKLEDMAANKLLALTDRRIPASRDVFDTYFILRNKIDINETIIKDRTGLSLLEYLKKAIDYVEENFQHDLLDALGELVDQKQKSWVKNKMKQDTLMQLRIRLDSLENSFGS